MPESHSDDSVSAGPQKCVGIGRLLRVRGNRGELVGELDSSAPGREERLSEVTLDLNGRTRVARVERVWRNPAIYDGRPVFKFEGIDSIPDAEAWEGAQILVAAADVAQPGEGEYSHADLIGSRVIDLRAPRADARRVSDPGGDGVEGSAVGAEAANESAGAAIGVVEGIEEYGGAPLLAVRTTDGREILIPFARSICKQIDASAKTIGVELPEGLLDLP